jgi:DNA-binding HxlR family transcriptional regulator
MSSSVLCDRLSDLHAAGLVTKDDNGDYALTPLGADLGSVLDPLDQWSRRWAKDRNAREGNSIGAPAVVPCSVPQALATRTT